MKKWKRGLSVVLAMTMVMGLSACGLYKSNKNSSINKNDNNVNNAKSDLAKQNVYRLEEYDFSSALKEGEDAYVQNIQLVNGRLYTVVACYNYNSESGSETRYRLVSMNTDGSDMKSCEIMSSLEGSDALKDNPESENSEADESAEADASPEADEGSETESAVDLDVADDMSEIRNVYERTNLEGFQVVGDRIWGCKSHYLEDYSDPENYVSVNDKYVCAWDMDGNMLFESRLNLPSDENSWCEVSCIAGRGNGKAMVLINMRRADNSNVGAIDVDEEGNTSELRPIEGLNKYMQNPGSMTVTLDETIMMTYYDENWEKQYVVTYDYKKDYVGEGFPLPSTVANNIGTPIVDASGDLVYTSSMGVYKYHIGDENGTQLMNFINSDLDISYLSAVCPIDNDHFIGIYSQYNEEQWYSMVKGGLFTRVPPEDIPDKQVLVLGGNYISSDIRSRVIEYNKSSNTHRITMKDYKEYTENGDYNEGITRLNNDIISGNMPDILVVNSYSMTLDNYISKGLLADVGELIEEDAELSNTEFMKNVFDACRVNGKLYEIVPSFAVSTYVAKRSLVGDRIGWTMQEAEKCLASMPEGANLIGEMTRPSFISNAMEMCGNDFIDVSTGKCNFDSPAFISLMEYAKGLPEALDEDYYSENWYELYRSQYRENRTLLAYCEIYNIQNLVDTINGYFGEDISYVGFPNSGGQGSVIKTGETYALSAKSNDIEAAWDFMRYYLTDEYQKEIPWMLPVNKKYFDERAEKAAKKPTYKDENGKEVEYEYTWWINDESIILDPLTPQQLQEAKDFISSVNTRIYYNNDVNNIITEELDAFYQGQKSAKDVAGIIQSRTQLFVNENR